MPKETNKRTSRQKDADELHMTSNLAAPSINLLTLIEGNTASIDTTLDISLSAFRDAILGAGTKDFSTIQTVLDSIKDTDGIKKITDAVTVIQPVAANLNATVTQLAKDRTITGTATVTQVAKDRTVTGAVTVYRGKMANDILNNFVNLVGNNVDIVIWVPDTDNKIVITDIVISSNGNGLVFMYSIDADVVRSFISANNPLVISLESHYTFTFPDDVLRIDTDLFGVDDEIHVTVYGYEVD